MYVDLSLGSWLARACVAGSLLVAACAPAAGPSPTAAPAKQAEKPAAAQPAPTTAPAAKPAAAKPAEAKPTAKAESLDELYEKAKREGGQLSFYSTLATVNAEKLLPVFEKRFPGIKVEQIDATGDKLVARAISEARGGKVLADVFETNLEYVAQLYDQKLLLELVPPEGAAYPNTLKGPYWVSTDLQFIIAAWNTNLVKKDEEPKQFDDFADPRWKNRIIAEPRDYELLMGLAKYKFNSDERAADLIKRIAANNVEFHKGHSELAEFLVAGQGAVCLTCYSHHYPPRIKKGAPVNYLLSEGIGDVQGVAVFKDAPHPNTAMLWYRWIISQEGQQEMAKAGRTPAHPNVQPVEKTRPEKIYALAPELLKERPKYEKIWKEIFGLR